MVRKPTSLSLYSATYTIPIRKAIHDEETDSLIGLQALDGVRMADSFEFTGELGGGAVPLHRESLFVGNIIRFSYKNRRFKLMILSVEREEMEVKLVEEDLA